MPLATVVIHRYPTCTVTVDGTELPDVVTASGSYGFSKAGPCEAQISVTRLPSWVGVRALVEVACGATDATTFTRFKGEVYDFPSYQMLPRSVAIDCRGRLIKADRILVPEDLDNKDTPGLDLSNKTQVQQLVAIFNQVGLNGSYSLANLGGPPHILGTLTSDKPGAANANVWKRSQSAQSRAQALDKIGLGYRLVEGPLPGSTDFGIYRPQISPRPGVPLLTLNEGVDIGRDTTASHNDALNVYNRVVVTGGDFGDGPVKAEETAPHPNPDPLVAYQTAPIYSSPLIEQAEPVAPANGISAREIARWRIVEEDQIILKMELSTPRSDLLHLEKSVQVNAFDRFEVQQAMWLQEVGWRCNAREVFRQKLSLRAPAAVGVGGVAIPQERFFRPAGTTFFFPTRTTGGISP